MDHEADAAPGSMRSAAYLLAGAPLGLAWLLVAAVGLLAGGTTLVIGVGVPLLLGVLLLTRFAAGLDRRLIGRILGVPVAAPASGPPALSWTAASAAVLADAQTWRSMGWMLFRAVAGVLVLAGAAVSAVVLVALLVVPFRAGYLQWGDSWRSPSGWTTAWTPLAGAVGLLLLMRLAPLIAQVHIRVAQLLLTPDLSADLARMSEEAQRAQERMTLARDLHDSIGHAMTLVAVQAAAAAAALDRDPAFVRSALGDIAGAARGALDELDAALAALRDDGSRAPDPAADPAARYDLTALLHRAERAGIQVTLRPPDGLTGSGVSAAVAEAVYRVVQEACTNALKHSRPASAATACVDRDAETLRIRVRNPFGHAGATPPGGRTGSGLAGARERFQRLGGSLTAGPDEDGCWLVDAAIPLRGASRSGLISEQPGEPP